MNRSKQNTGGKYVRIRKIKPYDMGMQVPYSVDVPKKLYEKIRKELGRKIRRLAKSRGSEILDDLLMSDYIHILIAIPPKYAVSQMIGYIKGKSAIYVARKYGGRGKYYSGQHMWARRYFVSTVGRDEEAIRKYKKNQGIENKRPDMDLGWFPELK